MTYKLALYIPLAVTAVALALAALGVFFIKRRHKQKLALRFAFVCFLMAAVVGCALLTGVLLLVDIPSLPQLFTPTAPTQTQVIQP